MMLYSFYAYSFYFGGYLRYKEVLNNGKIYTGGTLIGIMFAVMFGSWSLGTCATHVSAIKESQVAGKLVFEVIEHIPKIRPDDQNADKVSNESVKGKIEFKNVNFTFPTRPDLQVLKDFSLMIEAGKTTALVGPSGSGKSTVIQLIERFYDPTSGTVSLDGKDITSLNLSSIRQ